MQYDIPLTLDMNNQPTGVFASFTNEGPIIIIFQNKANMQDFATKVNKVIIRQKQKIGSFSIEAASMQEVVRQLIKIDPSLGDGDTQFISDLDPFYKTILNYFTQNA